LAIVIGVESLRGQLIRESEDMKSIIEDLEKLKVMVQQGRYYRISSEINKIIEKIKAEQESDSA
jgi:hypothetical protein